MHPSLSRRAAAFVARRLAVRCALLAAAFCVVQPVSAADRVCLAVTIDDLPVATRSSDMAVWTRTTDALLKTLTERRVPATGFAIQGRLYENGALVDARVDLLRQWLQAGMDLGNHTYSHQSLNGMTADAWLADAAKSADVLRGVIEKAGKKLVYFRHPFLHTGRDEATRDASRQGLAKLGYVIAPVSIDNDEWMFAFAYEQALLRGDAALADRIRADYLAYMANVIDYWLLQAERIVGRPMSHILLIHANQLNAVALGDVLDIVAKRGLPICPLAEALRDPVWQSDDRFFGAGGISWIHRWGLTRKLPKETYAGEPAAPEYVKKLGAP